MKKLNFSALAKPSRKVLLTTAAILATTGAVGAAALVAPANFELSRIVSIATAQTVSTVTDDPAPAALPFDRVAQAPTTSDQSTPVPTAAAPEAAPASTPAPQTVPTTESVPTAQTPTAPTPPVAQAPTPTPSSSTPPTRQSPDVQSPTAQAPAAPAPTAQVPVGQAPVAVAPVSAPQRQMIHTSSRGVIIRQQPQPQSYVYRPRTVYISEEYCE